jgi:hypothetical protein
VTHPCGSRSSTTCRWRSAWGRERAARSGRPGTWGICSRTELQTQTSSWTRSLALAPEGRRSRSSRDRQARSGVVRKSLRVPLMFTPPRPSYSATTLTTLARLAPVYISYCPSQGMLSEVLRRFVRSVRRDSAGRLPILRMRTFVSVRLVDPYLEDGCGHQDHRARSIRPAASSPGLVDRSLTLRWWSRTPTPP